MCQTYFSRLWKTSATNHCNLRYRMMGITEWRWEINEEPRFSFPATECILVVSRLSPRKRRKEWKEGV